MLSLRSRNAPRTRYRDSTRRSSTPKIRARLAHETLDLHPPTSFRRTSDHSVCASVPNSSLERFQTKPQIANRNYVVVWRVERFYNGVIGPWMLPGKLPCNGSSQYRSVQVMIVGDSLVWERARASYGGQPVPPYAWDVKETPYRAERLHPLGTTRRTSQTYTAP